MFVPRMPGVKRLPRDGRNFFAEYRSVHPSGNEHVDVDKQLYRMFSKIQFEFATVTDKRGPVYVHVPDGSLTLILEDMNIYWLFDGMPLVGSFDKLQSFIIEKNDPDLSDTDYLLLFYISLQNADVQKVTDSVPLSMLYDMFAPVAEENIRRRRTVGG
jgi:hypothetical protein